jgi:hypothetical protein
MTVEKGCEQDLIVLVIRKGYFLQMHVFTSMVSLYHTASPNILWQTMHFLTWSIALSNAMIIPSYIIPLL